MRNWQRVIRTHGYIASAQTAACRLFDTLKVWWHQSSGLLWIKKKFVFFLASTTLSLFVYFTSDVDCFFTRIIPVMGQWPRFSRGISWGNGTSVLQTDGSIRLTWELWSPKMETRIGLSCTRVQRGSHCCWVVGTQKTEEKGGDAPTTVCIATSSPPAFLLPSRSTPGKKQKKKHRGENPNLTKKLPLQDV